jgi:hypothetical protein
MLKNFNLRKSGAIIVLSLAFSLGWIFQAKVEAQSSSTCPPGSIGNCTSLEMLGTRCRRGACTINWFGIPAQIDCKATVYECSSPNSRIYTVNDCDTHCINTL